MIDALLFSIPPELDGERVDLSLIHIYADRTQKDSRSIYKECLYTLFEKVERSEIYPLLRDRDTTCLLYTSRCV